MADFGINPQGFKLKRLEDILSELEPLLEAITDPETGESLLIDFDDANDPISQLVGVLASNNAAAWEVLQQCYNAFDPAKATDSALGGLVQINGILRDTGSFSTIPIQVTGTPGVTVEAGNQISDNNQDVIWVIADDILIGGGGTGTGTANSEEKGPFNAPINTVESILTPVPGWTAVTNTSASTLGEEPEDDTELRRRRDRSTEVPSISPVEAIYGNLLNLSGVTFARVLVNNTLSTDSRGIPAKQIAAIVLGGDDEEIARTLFLRSPTGAEYFGNTSFNLTDLQGETYTISWTRPTERDIEVVVNTVIDTNLYPGNGDEAIKDAIVIYSQQGAPGLGIDDGFDELGFVPGRDVENARLYTPCNSVPGHNIQDILIDFVGGTPAEQDLTIGDFEQSIFDKANITVNQV